MNRHVASFPGHLRPEPCLVEKDPSTRLALGSLPGRNNTHDGHDRRSFAGLILATSGCRLAFAPARLTPGAIDGR